MKVPKMIAAVLVAACIALTPASVNAWAAAPALPPVTETAQAAPEDIKSTETAQVDQAMDETNDTNSTRVVEEEVVDSNEKQDDSTETAQAAPEDVVPAEVVTTPQASDPAPADTAETKDLVVSPVTNAPATPSVQTQEVTQEEAPLVVTVFGAQTTSTVKVTVHTSVMLNACQVYGMDTAGLEHRLDNRNNDITAPSWSTTLGFKEGTIFVAVGVACVEGIWWSDAPVEFIPDDPELKTVTPTAPSYKEVDGANNDVVTPPTITGVIYDCTAWTNGTKTCKATPAEGFKFPEGAQTTWTFTDKNTQPEPGDDDEVQNPTDPRDPTDPQDPVDPKDPQNPADPQDPKDPAAPQDPKAPIVNKPATPVKVVSPSTRQLPSGTGPSDYAPSESVVMSLLLSPVTPIVAVLALAGVAVAGLASRRQK